MLLEALPLLLPLLPLVLLVVPSLQCQRRAHILDYFR